LKIAIVDFSGILNSSDNRKNIHWIFDFFIIDVFEIYLEQAKLPPAQMILIIFVYAIF